MAARPEYFNQATYPIHIADGSPIAPGGKFRAKGDEAWLLALLDQGVAAPVHAAAPDDGVDEAAKVQGAPSDGDNGNVTPPADKDGAK